MGDEAWPVVRRAVAEQLGCVLDSGPGPRTVAVQGAAGMGKTTLLRGLGEQARSTGWRVLRCRGSQSESRLAFAGLYQLLRPVLPSVETLSARQRSVLHAAFGLADSAGAGDDLQICVATLTLLSELSGVSPILLVVDDVQWLDSGSVLVLSFLSRRIDDDHIRLALGARGSVPRDFDQDIGIAQLEPLTPDEAGRLLDAQPAPPRGRARAAVLEQSGGNPLALVELTKAVAADPTAVARWTAEPLPLPERLERSFVAAWHDLPAATRRALVVAAAADQVDLELVLLARVVSLDAQTWAAAETAGLVRVAAGRLEFSHPLIRSAVYHAAPSDERAAAHRVLADALRDRPERRAWHLAAATTLPDEAVAEQLSRVAAAAWERGSMHAAAAAWQRAAELSPDAHDAAARLIQAAHLATVTGDTDAAEHLATRAVELSDEPLIRAQARRTLGWALSLTDRYAAAVSVLLDVAAEQARSNLFAAWRALVPAVAAAFQSGDPALLAQVSAAFREMAEPPREWIESPGVRVESPELPSLWIRVALAPFTARERNLVELRRYLQTAVDTAVLPVLAGTARLLDESALAVEFWMACDQPRETITHGPTLTTVIWAMVDTGHWDEALELAGRARAVAAVHHEPIVSASAAAASALISAGRGDTEGASRDAATALSMVDLSSTSALAVRAHHAAGVAAAMAGNHDAAYAHLATTIAPDGSATHYYETFQGLADLAEAAVRTGHRAEGARLVDGALDRMEGRPSERITQVAGHARGLLAEDASAERHFTRALADPAGERWPLDRGRVHLGYGQWLRRQRRTVDARPHLELAAATFERLSATGWQGRARAELRAAGVRQRPRTGDPLATLSSAERQIVQLVAHGLSNREIGDQLFLSPRTVGSHLYRAFPKLGITSRGQLRDVLDGAARP